MRKKGKKMRHFAIAAGISSAALMAAGAGFAQTRPAGGTVVYKVTADTYSGFGAAFMGGRGAGSMMGAMLSGRAANPNGSAHMLNLELDSNRTPAGEPMAEHLPPPGLGVGASLPLLTPRPERGAPAGREAPGTFEKPRGRILIFWGCGEKARPGQPVVIDFAKMAQGQLTPQMEAMLRMSPQQMARMGGAMAGGASGRGQYATVGLWPNERTRNQPPPSGSLVGDHVVRGNYSPEIRFSLSPAQDYLAAFQATQSPLGSGAVGLTWRQIPNALGYSAMAVGGEQDTMVMWTSSEAQTPASPGEFASAAEVQRLVAQRMMLAPSVTQCAVPAEAVKAMGGGGFLTMQAVGPTSSFSYPPRPAKAPAGWAPDWIAKVQTRATYMSMLGQDGGMMGGMADEEDERSAGQQPQQPKKKKKGLLDGLIRPF